MTRPDIVRADTLDLQDTATPSAKDHSRQPASPKPLGDGPPAPHQAQALRKASLDGYDLHVRSPRASKDLSDKELQLLHDVDPDDQDIGADNEHMSGGGQDAAGNDIGADEDDDDMDDDMMDKISSSPSIDDGGCTATVNWPRRKDSLLQNCGRLDSENLSLRPDRSPRGTWRTTSNLRYTVCTGTISMSEEEDAAAKIANESSSERPNQPGSRFKENFDDSGLDLTEADFEHYGDFEWDEQSSYSGDLMFEPHSVSQIPYEPKAQFQSPPDVEESNSWQGDESLSGTLDEELMWANLDDRFIDSGWGGECLRELEDIDFEFVYALHTFVATVEGQANATKGDTMVLLDDSNSYWWLVKVVKDSSIGYLPAEHIETPTERLARLNKHRNIDLSQTMLGDNPEKSRNPLKKAMRRRNAKTVQFAEPQYFEPSEPSYSSDEEDGDIEERTAAAQAAEAQSQAQSQQAQQQNQQKQDAGEDQTAVVEPLRTQKQQSNGVDSQSPTKDGSGVQNAERDQPRPSTESFDSETGGSRRMRNTDSFYKDDSVETRKISLTPNILKDSSNSGAAPVVQELKQEPRSSFDSQKSIEKLPATTEKEKKKEKKEKKGVLGGLFKRKNSKNKQEKEKEDRDDLSGTTAVSSRKQSVDTISIESGLSSPTATTPNTVQAQQKIGKLQKAPPPAKSSSILKRAPSAEDRSGLKTVGETTGADASQTESQLGGGRGAGPALAPAPLQTRQEPSSLRLVPQEEAPPAEPASTPTAPRGIFSPIQTILGSSNSEPKEPKPEKVKKAKNRMALEDSEDSDEETPTAQQSVVSKLPSALRPAPEPVDAARVQKQRLSESPVEVSPVLQAQLHPTHASGSTADAPPSPLSANSTPELLDHPSESDLSHTNVRTRQQGPVATKTPEVDATPSASETSSPVTASDRMWSPAALRAYLDSDGANDVRDLILLVHDTSDVKDLPPNHELLRGFGGDKQRLDGMSKRLDSLLGEVLSRRSAPAA